MTSRRRDSTYRNIFLQLRLGLAFALDVIANNLLIMGDHPGLFDRRPVPIDDDASMPGTLRPQFLQQQASSFIRADDAAEVRLAAQCQNIVKDIGGSAEPHGFRFDMNHGHRRLGGNPAHAAPNVMIKNKIADDED